MSQMPDGRIPDVDADARCQGIGTLRFYHRNQSPNLLASGIWRLLSISDQSSFRPSYVERSDATAERADHEASDFLGAVVERPT